MPGSLAMAPMRARSVRRPSTGVRSSLKSPECRIVPCGVWNAGANPCGTECVTGRKSTSNGPMRRRSPSNTGKRKSRKRNDSPPTWSSWPCVAMQPSMRSALSRRYVKSGRTRSIPSMSMSGNINPQSRSMMRPSTSMHAQFRPISPRPPRNVIETGSGMEVGVHLSGAVLGAGGRRAEWQPAVAHRHAERAHHRLRRLREDARVAVLELVRLDQAGVDLAGTRDVALLECGDHLPELRRRPVRGDTDDTNGADGEQRERQRVVTAVHAEARRARQQL